MVDISKCMGVNCQSRHKCYRFTAPSNPYRQGFMFFEKKIKGDRCSDFYDRYDGKKEGGSGEKKNNKAP